LYKYASIGWPLINGSLGNFISRGIISECGAFAEVVREARVLARPLKSATPDDGAGAGKLGADTPNVGLPGDKFDDESELKD
jgi:hypothetical protein